MDEEAILQQAREEFKLSVDAFMQVRTEAEDDIRFFNGEQWPIQVATNRKLQERPIITINKTPQFVNQVVNDGKQNKPSIKVHPVDDGADIETAKILQELVRSIETTSGGPTCYMDAFSSQVKCGIGFFRIITEYIDGKSFDQVIKISRVANPLSVYFDPSVTELDYCDAKFCFLVSDIEAELFKQMYPDITVPTSWDSDTSGAMSGWFTYDTVRVAEYYKVVETRSKLYLLEDGRVINSRAAKDGMKIVKERDVVEKEVHWYKITGTAILEHTIVPGEYIPVVPVLGPEEIVDGERHYLSLIRFAKDAQRMYNYWASTETELLALAPKAPFVAPLGTFKGLESKWNAANTRNMMTLEYNPVYGPSGETLPGPSRQAFASVPTGVVEAKRAASEDMKSTTGIYDASLGSRSNETSGTAILARQREGDTSTYHFIDKLSVAIRHAGKIILGMIPEVYDMPRILKITGLDGESSLVGVNGKTVENQERQYDLTYGGYDVAVDVGPSYMTKRMEASNSMMQFVQAMPQTAQLIGDLIAKNMDWPGAQEIADRLKLSLPPALQGDEGEDKQAQQQIQAIQQQSQEAIGALQSELARVQAKLDSKELQTHLDYAAKMAKIESDREIAGMAHRVDIAKYTDQALREAQVVEAQTAGNSTGPIDQANS